MAEVMPVRVTVTFCMGLPPPETTVPEIRYSTVVKSTPVTSPSATAV
jgi:hypothetical protein